MAVCDDRQLTEAQRQAGYQNQRTGVQQAVRPFSGRPTLENLIDYINRELQPAVRRTRDAVNDVYLQVADNAPSGNPLAYYFSTETAAADPTVGRIRLDASPQNTATTIRISQTNARLVDVAPWLDVMAGSSTTPLGVVTLSDAINPGRAIRFDLSTMVDQGDYWDLGVSVIEATHPDPFVEGEAVVLAFIPGVASTGTTVPPSALTPIAAQSVLGNPTSAVAAPVAIALNDLSVLGRAGVLGTNVAGIDVPGTGTFTGESVFLRVASTRLAIQWRPWTLVDMPEISTSRFVGNVSGATARPAYTSFGDLSSNSITFEFTGETFIREELNGDVFAAQNDNVTLIQPNVVSDTKLRDSGPLSVIGRAANSTGDPGDISAVAASGAVLRESGSTLGFGTIATAGLADDSVTNAKLAEMAANTVKANATSATANPTDFAVGANTVLGRVAADIVSAQLVNAQITDATIANAKLANMAAGTFKGRLVTASTGVPTDLTGAEAAAGLRYATIVDTTTTGTVVSYAPTGFDAATTNIRISPTANVVLRGMPLAVGQQIAIRVGRSSAFTVTLNSEDGSANAGEQFNTPNNVALVMRAGEACIIRNAESRNNVIASARSTVADADYGDITVSANGATWTIDNDVVTDAKLRNSAALSVIGRSANSTGDPADISAVAASGAVLRESGSTLGFGTIATAGITDAAVTLAKMANLAAGTVIGRQGDAGAGVPVALTGAEVGEILRLGTTQLVNSALPLTITLNADTTYLIIDSSGTGNVNSISGATPGRVLVVANTNFGTKTFIHGGGTGQFICPGLVNLQLTVREALILVGDAALPAWQVFSVTRVGIGLTDGDKGDITVATSGTAWTIDNDVVSNAKLRNSAALSVIGRSVNSTGDPGDIATTSGSSGVLVESGGTLSFGLVTTNNILDNTIANADLRQSAALSVVGRTFNTIGNVADISAVAGSDAVLRESGSNIAFGQIATGGIANDAVTDGKLRNGGALSVIGRSANSTGDVADISGTASSDQVLRISGTTLGFGTVATAGIADAAVTLAKQADLAQSRIIGRAEGAGTGVPTALTPTQVVSIIDGEAVTWTGSHTFNGTNFTVTAGGDVAITASGGTTTLAATTQVQITSPTRLASSIAFDSVGTTATTAANNLAINSVNVVRFTGPPNPLTGMVPVVNGQTVLLINAHATDDMVIQLDSPSSSAANRFAGEVTDRHIKPGEMALAWYDGTSTVWRLLCRDDVDL